jgi:opacity protein-like surface antigen
MRSKLVLAALFLAAAVQVFSQTAPAAIESGLRLVVGAGVSSYNANYNYNPNYSENYQMEGGTIWVDTYLNRGPALFHGLGLELEGRDISIGRPSTAPSNLREDTAGGGAIYGWRHFRNFTPYGKFLVEQASIDFHTSVPTYNHDTRDLFAGGAGVDYRIGHNIWVRGGYEYEYWQRLFQNHQVSTHTGILVRPRGVTVGASYSFNHFHLY